jgi:hypothetical protein
MDCQCCALFSSGLLLQDCRFRFAQTASKKGPLPKAYHKVISFVAFLGKSLDEFASDINSWLRLELRFTNIISSNLLICNQWE